MSIAARRMSRIKASPAAMISAKAMEMARAGRDVIALSAGEPDFDTPDPIKIAAIRAIVEGKTKYPPLTGIPELREAICRKLGRENGLRYAPDQVLVCNGGKQVIYNALAATLDPEDEVVVPAPFWVSYPDMALLAGGRPVVVAADAANGFRLTAEQLEGAITAQTKWLILNNPATRPARSTRPRIWRGSPRCCAGIPTCGCSPTTSTSTSSTAASRSPRWPRSRPICMSAR